LYFKLDTEIVNLGHLSTTTNSDKNNAPQREGYFHSSATEPKLRPGNNKLQNNLLHIFNKHCDIILKSLSKRLIKRLFTPRICNQHLVANLSCNNVL